MAEGTGKFVRPLRLFENTEWHRRYHDTLLRERHVCVSENNELKKAGCPSTGLKNIKEVAEKVSEVDDNSKKLGPEMIEKLWLHMAEREKLFLSSPTVETAELDLTNALLK